MIRAIEISGFRSLRHVRLELGPLNVLIGPNQSGKTNVLDALSFLANAVAGRLQESVFKQRGGFGNLLWMGEGARAITFRVELEGVARHGASSVVNEYRCRLEEEGSDFVVAEETLREEARVVFWRDRTSFRFGGETGADPSGVPLLAEWRHELLLDGLMLPNQDSAATIRRVADALSSFAVYPGFDVRTRWASSDPRNTAPMRQPQFIENAPLLSPLGDNLVNVLYALKEGAGAPLNGGPRRDRWREFKDALRVGFPDFEDIAISPDAGMGRIAFAWLDRRFPGRRIPAEVLSDGTLCFLALAAAVMSPGVPALTAIDEPEMHLHPELLYRLVGLLEQASAGRQILVTTHSDALLSFLSDPSSVILAANGPEGTTLTRPDRAALDEWLKDYTLGELREAGHLQAFAASGAEAEPSQASAANGGET